MRTLTWNQQVILRRYIYIKWITADVRQIRTDWFANVKELHSYEQKQTHDVKDASLEYNLYYINNKIIYQRNWNFKIPKKTVTEI